MKIELSVEDCKILINYLSKKSDNPILYEIQDCLKQYLESEFEVQKLLEEAPYPLSENQIEFVRDIFNLDLEINWNYSGRSMMGKICPAVVLSSGGLKTSADYMTDNMGFDTVFYARF